mmetsp:Transcript_13556/g.53747  ORF Transcript_13556/g.53747 Transcript_13556/m.53747 type:complete len:214 (-) Transcript_13556:2-643(-)
MLRCCWTSSKQQAMLPGPSPALCHRSSSSATRWAPSSKWTSSSCARPTAASIAHPSPVGSCWCSHASSWSAATAKMPCSCAPRVPRLSASPAAYPTRGAVARTQSCYSGAALYAKSWAAKTAPTAASSWRTSASTAATTSCLPPAAPPAMATSATPAWRRHGLAVPRAAQCGAAADATVRLAQSARRARRAPRACLTAAHPAPASAMYSVDSS